MGRQWLTAAVNRRQEQRGQWLRDQSWCARDWCEQSRAGGGVAQSDRAQLRQLQGQGCAGLRLR